MLLLLLLHGPPGSGKSSIGSALRDTLRTLHHCEPAAAGRQLHIECVELDECMKTIEASLPPQLASQTSGDVRLTFSPEVWSAAWSEFRATVARKCAELSAAASEYDYSCSDDETTRVSHILAAIDTMHYASMRNKLLRQVSEACDNISMGSSQRILLLEILVWPGTLERCMARNALRSGVDRIPDDVVERSYRAAEKEISSTLLRRIDNDECDALLLVDPERRHRGVLLSSRAGAPDLARVLLRHILALHHSLTSASRDTDGDGVTLSSYHGPKCLKSCGTVSCCHLPGGESCEARGAASAQSESVDHVYDLLLRRAVQQHMQRVLEAGGNDVKRQSRACAEARRRLLHSFEAKGAFRGLIQDTDGQRSEMEELVDTLFHRVLPGVAATEVKDATV